MGRLFLLTSRLTAMRMVCRLAQLHRMQPSLDGYEYRMTSVLNVDTIADKAGTGPVG